MAIGETFEHIRAPAVAGYFYPEDPGELRAAVDAHLADARPAHREDPGTPWPKAVIAPHAGYAYSAPVAAAVYARLEAARGTVERVVLLGPSHRVGFAGLAVTGAGAYATPLGLVPVDARAVARIAGFERVLLMDEAHAREHGLEVHLPFLQTVLGDFRLVPIVVGDAAPEDVARVLDALWGGPETLIVVSSDLSHHHDYAAANEMDGATCRAVQTLEIDEVTTEGACGAHPVRGLMALARRRDLRVTLVDRRNSGDTAGPRDRVVGYGSFIVEEGGRQGTRTADGFVAAAAGGAPRQLRDAGAGRAPAGLCRIARPAPPAGRRRSPERLARGVRGPEVRAADRRRVRGHRPERLGPERSGPAGVRVGGRPDRPAEARHRRPDPGGRGKTGHLSAPGLEALPRGGRFPPAPEGEGRARAGPLDGHPPGPALHGGILPRRQVTAEAPGSPNRRSRAPATASIRASASIPWVR